MRIDRIAPASPLLLVVSLWASRAAAQGPAANPPAPPAAPAAPAPAPAAPAAPAEPREDTATDQNTDHDRFVGHLGVGYFGISQIPIATAVLGGTIATQNVSAPVIGVRYWFTERVGLDVGAGMSLSAFSNGQTPAPNPAPQNPPAIFGFALHGGVPLALATAKHFTFELIPEVTFGYALTTIDQPAQQPSIGVHGLRLDVGARVGGGINFGFIGLPQLALQGTVGLSARYVNVGASQDGLNGGPARSASNGTLTLGTSVGSDPWAIFTNNISALYYF